MRAFIISLLTLSLLLAACGIGDDSSGNNNDTGGAAEAETCSDVGAAAIDSIQQLLNDVGDLSLSDLQKAGGEEQPEAIQNLQDDVDELQAKAQELGCTDEAIAGYLKEHVDELEAAGDIPQMLLDAFKEEINNGTFFQNDSQ